MATTQTAPAAVRRTQGTPYTTPGSVNVTHGSVDAPPPRLALDLVLGDRPEAVTCSNCSRHVAGLEQPRFELETPDGDVLCLICADKSHHGVRLAVAVLNAALDARQAGDHKAALETIAAVVNGLELLDEQTPRPAYQRPARRQPVRHNRRGRRG
jgi:hypothetical protein